MSVATIGVYGFDAAGFLAALAETAIAYEHRPELAPTTELRQLQYAEDDRRGEGRRSRTELAPLTALAPMWGAAAVAPDYVP